MLAFRLDKRSRLLHDDSLVGLAGIFADFVRERRGPDVRQGNFALRVDGKPFGADAKSLPPATSYLLSASQGDTEVLARIETDPVLGRRRVGLGRTVCLALPLAKGKNEHWKNSDPAAKMLAGALKWCLRRGGDPRFTGRIVHKDKSVRFRLDAHDGPTPMNALGPRLIITTPAAGRPRTLDLAQVAPGGYEAELAQPDGLFMLRAVDGKGQHLWQGAFSAGYPEEFSSVGAHWENLRLLAELTGGRIVPAGNIAELSHRWSRGRYISCWPALAALGVLLMLADWVSTRKWKRWQ